MNVLVAGGAGYIGSHTVKRLKEAGHNPVIYDNLSRGHRTVVDILKVPAVAADLNDRETLVRTLGEHKIDTVMHFAAFAYVGESVDKPLMYYQNNVATTVSVLQAMQDAGVNRFVFSSTCAVYGDPPKVPITEDMPKGPVSPYGRSKLLVEQILQDVPLGWKDFKFAALRYFNASGCAMDGSIGEDHDPETHLIPVVLQSVLGVRPGITVFGTDYPTKDGTNVRDYIHVDDLADAHIAAAGKLDEAKQIFCNLGTGHGFSVKEIIATAEKVAGKKVPVTYGPRRAGDAIALYADPSRARQVLGWEAKHKDPETII
ncbi:MAG TPA: UDP-glucose 4-epimerase GalE, partial [Actinomycetota bacterium]|nr:UDP-glucose 4-epimerase GalE [Actinomycetota bacterium]